MAASFDIDPKIAMLSFSNFGRVSHSSPESTAKAVKILRQRRPYLPVNGEMQADMAWDRLYQYLNTKHIFVS